MAKYTAYFETTASVSVEMDVPDEVAADGAEAISEWIYENNPHGMSICAQCGGWGKTGFSMDLADFEPDTHGEGPHQGLAYVTDADGNTVTD